MNRTLAHIRLRQRSLLLPLLLIALWSQHSLAGCTDPAAVAATRAAADEACTRMGMGCLRAKNHGAYVSCVAHQAKAATKAGTLPKDCKGPVVRCAAQSTCGKPGVVTCCRSTVSGKTTCSIKSNAARCKTTKHHTACVGQHASCCDACIGGGCTAGTTTTTTVITTTTSMAANTTTTATLACGGFVTMWGTQGMGDGQFQGPGWLGNDGAGHVYVTDRYNNRVEKFDEIGTFVTAWGSAGSGNGQFSAPAGIVVGPGGTVVYV